MSIAFKPSLQSTVLPRPLASGGIVAQRPLERGEVATLKTAVGLLTELAKFTPRAELKAELKAEAGRLQGILDSGRMVGGGSPGMKPTMNSTLEGVDKYLSQVEAQFPPGTAMGNMALARHEDLQQLQWVAKRAGWF